MKWKSKRWKSRPLAVVKTALSSAVENGVSLLRTHSIVMAKPIQEIFGERAD